MYYAVFAPCVDEIVIKRSKFITTLMPIADETDAERKIAVIRKRYSDATHNCWAYIASLNGSIQRFSDDGEPQGTAGVPMLDVLKKRNISMTLAVVTRCFGGVKLGAGGLVSAYTHSVAVCLDKADVRKFEDSIIASVSLSYTAHRRISEIIKCAGKIIDIRYHDAITIEFAIPQHEYAQAAQAISNITLGDSKAVIIERRFVDYAADKLSIV